ncbi:FAD-dependent monooxygenase [Kutzneria kofuensis]|uniref:2-polyprenyl-6-methoxyphenol hydroxylase-like FAD-dependent oxidoreductase n=1 Tax=Kutzneria kofuensis TaxID=103725 RepID=A0A7W9KRL7_9PSEU|nr:FAD-dependent monooxygenase [Kutzneria kofuensis]MBB5897452.1 2-polyprenyl-6-methoxyphenol hydroxylase-like FAD-dependent oxidoreductase [Kutzneria kofuensis]
MSRVLVVGGGISGLTTAIALRHAGMNAAVYEAHPTGADGRGAFLTIMANGLDALRAIDAEHLVLDRSFASKEVRMLNGHDRRLGVLTIPSPDPEHGPRTMRRADLYRVLVEEARRRGVEIVHGKRLVGVRHHGSVTAFFGDGTRTGGDLLIGADGVHSTTRTLIDPNAPQPAYTGWNIAMGAARDVLPASHRDCYYMYFGRRATCGHITAPDGETWWFANVPCGEQELAGVSPAVLRQRLGDLFAGDRIGTVQAIRATADEQLTATACYQLPSLPTWSRAGMTLVGDALHVASPSTTQGASMAIEDAVTLAKCLRDDPDTTAALLAYERLRRERVERVVRTGFRKLGPRVPGPLRRLLRDRAVARRARNPDVDWLHLHHIDWDSDRTTAG